MAGLGPRTVEVKWIFSVTDPVGLFDPEDPPLWVPKPINAGREEGGTKKKNFPS